jgi:hypothetical protein
MSIIYKLLSIILITFIFTSCGKCRCIDDKLNPNFILFDTTEVDTIIIKKFSKNSSFTSLLDTGLFDEKNSFRIKKSNDTITFPARVGNFSITSDYDWIFFLPAINKTIKISDIISEQTSMPCPGKVQCINPINSLKIDDVINKPNLIIFI